MFRRLTIVTVAAAILPASADAARIRFGGGRASHVKPAAAAPRPAAGVGVGVGVVATPRFGDAARANGQPDVGACAQGPFPPSRDPTPVLLRLTTADAPRPWCVDATLLGGFCVVD